MVGAQGLNLCRRNVSSLLLGSVICCAALGCGTTRWSDTSRTATEQMLLSDAVERSIARMDFTVLQGKTVYLDAKYLDGVTDSKFVISTMRQHMLASGCALKDNLGEAEFVVEARAGTIGTDRSDLLFGMPAINLGGISPVPGVPTAIPEIALARRTDQKGVAKIAVFAYHRESGRPVWQSGSDLVASKARDLWVFGAGPFQKGTIYEGTQFAGGNLAVPLVTDNKEDEMPDPVEVQSENTFNNPKAFVKKAPEPKKNDTNTAAKPGDPLKTAMQPAVVGVNPAPAPASPPQQPPADGVQQPMTGTTVPPSQTPPAANNPQPVPPAQETAPPRARLLGPLWR